MACDKRSTHKHQIGDEIVLAQLMLIRTATWSGAEPHQLA
jgi:hypothetical protein